MIEDYFNKLGYNIMEFPPEKRGEHENWIRVELREPKSTAKPHNKETHSIYLAAWAGEAVGIYLTARDARKLATILIVAADKIDESNRGDENDF